MTAHFKASRHLARTVAMAAALLIASTAASVHAAGWTRMHGHRSAAMAAAPLVGEVSATRVFPLAIGLAWRDSAGLKSLLAQIYDPQSPQYRRYLSADDFTQRFGPTDTDYQAVAQHLQALGLRVVGQHANRLILDVEGNADQIQAAFHVRLHEYRRGDGSSFFGPDDEPSLDTGLPILHISGLDDFVKPHPLMVQSAVSSATPRIGSGPSGLLEGNDFRNAYAPGVSLNGAGQSVALFELDTYYPNDLASYRTQTGLNTPVTNVYLDGWDSSHTPGGGNGEVTLDIEMAMSMAPGQAQVIVYMGSGIDDVLNQIATEDRCKQISSSWGWGPANSTELQIEQQYAAQGQSYFNASGDSGAFTSDPGGNEDDPMQTLVGGTDLSLNGTGGSYASESAWSGSTGGVLSNVAIPSYQQGLSMANNGGSTSFRNAPDVGAAASGILLYANNGSLIDVGGTSCAAPLWAGFMALVNQQAVAAGKGTVGFLNPAIYNVGKGSAYHSDMHDISSGSNNGFNAVAGYDLVTGWGSPAGQPLINDLSLVAVPTPTPVISNTWRINAGGPSYTDSAGKPWSADENFTGGAANGNSNAISGTPDPTLYQTEHWGGSFSYAMNVPAGSYQVTLKFAEIFDGAAGQRLENVSINGSQVLASFDIFKDAGGMDRADDKVFGGIAPNASGQIVIQVSSAAGSPDGNAKISALQVIPMPPTPTPTATPTATATLTPTPVIAATWRVNAGGPAYTDSAGKPWSADENFTGGAANGNGNAISSTADPVLYQTERWGTPSFSYAFNVPAGSYQVTLKFAEIFDGAAGQRLENISLNGTQVLTGFDIFKDAGGMNIADDKVFANIAPNAGGQIVVLVASASGSPDPNAKISALQIIPQPAATSTPSPTATKTSVPPTATAIATATWTVTNTNTVLPTLVTTATNTAIPTAAPTAVPTADPTVVPTVLPTVVPTADPTAIPTSVPTAVPTADPTAIPTAVPTAVPTADPTAIPTAVPTAVPTADPTAIPTAVPTAVPTADPTAVPTAIPTAVPTAVPTAIPTPIPTATAVSKCSGIAAWNGNFHAYTAGTLVTYSGKLYKCLQSHTSEPNWDPVTVPALWSLQGSC